jgi:hypothetical protein
LVVEAFPVEVEVLAAEEAVVRGEFFRGNIPFNLDKAAWDFLFI